MSFLGILWGWFSTVVIYRVGISTAPPSPPNSISATPLPVCWPLPTCRNGVSPYSSCLPGLASHRSSTTSSRTSASGSFWIDHMVGALLQPDKSVCEIPASHLLALWNDFSFLPCIIIIFIYYELNSKYHTSFRGSYFSSYARWHRQ